MPFEAVTPTPGRIAASGHAIKNARAANTTAATTGAPGGNGTTKARTVAVEGSQQHGQWQAAPN